MEKYINEFERECYKDVRAGDSFSRELFHAPEYVFEDEKQLAFHSNLGSITVLDRMTGFGYRDIETGYRDPDGNFWLASGSYDVTSSGCKTVSEAIEWIKQRANTCDPDRNH